MNERTPIDDDLRRYALRQGPAVHQYAADLDTHRDLLLHFYRQHHASDLCSTRAIELTGSWERIDPSDTFAAWLARRHPDISVQSYRAWLRDIPIDEAIVESVDPDCRIFAYAFLAIEHHERDAGTETAA